METLSESEILETLLFVEDIDEDLKKSKEYMEWESFFSNSYSKKKKKNNSQYQKKRDNILKFMFSWFIRIKNMHKKPRKIIQFSIFLYYEGCPSRIWSVLTRLRLCLSYDKTYKLMKVAESIKIPYIKKWNQNKYFYEIGADNCAYYNNRPIERLGKVSHFTNTINWYTKYSNLEQKEPPDDFIIFPNTFDQNQLQLR